MHQLNLDHDGKFVGNIQGGLQVVGDNVTLVVEGNIDGPISTSGNITCRNLDGTVNARDIQAQSIDGTVNARDVTARKVDGIVNASRFVEK
jgi:hypothetical protein